MFQTRVEEKIKTHFMFNKFFPKIVPFYEIMWKNITYFYDSISLSSSWNEKCFKVVKKIQTHILMFNNIFPKIVPFMR